MKLILRLLVLLLSVTATGPSAQPLSEQTAKDFISDLLERPHDLQRWVQADELAASRRLNITYFGVTNKFLISYDITDEIRDLVRKKAATVDFNIHDLDSTFTRLSLTFKNTEYKAEYYFVNDRLVSPIYYHSRNWHRFETDYFVFVVSDKSAFNRHSADKLDAFVAKTIEILSYHDRKRQQLKDAKIYYFLCKDSDDIQDLTGYNTRGLYNLAYDYIITTFNCHYHELVHLLANYRLQNLSLYTHPFFQEGIAVALGGRGGKEPPIILDMGAFLERSQFAKFQDYLRFESFKAAAPSLTYPLSGLYNAFLVNELGIKHYLSLYKKYSDKNCRSDIVKNDFPPDTRWKSFLENYSGSQNIDVRAREVSGCERVYDDTLAVIYQDSTDVHFKIKTAILLSDKEPLSEYKSKTFKEHFPKGAYRGEKYLITADQNEISVYDLYTNNLVAKYVSSMSVQTLPIKVEEGFYSFSVDRSVFDADLKEMTVEVPPPQEVAP